MDNKTQLRTRAKIIRKNLDMKAISLELTAGLREKTYYRSARNVMIFHPLDGEVNVLNLTEDDKNFYLPKVEGNRLKVCPYRPGGELKISRFRVFEPCSAAVDTDIIDLVIVPALMADRSNYRLGYGGGFYDRFLAENPHILSVVLIPAELTVDTLPVETHDVKINYIISV
ncbi:MAG: 5-formyltetrahydrofolate cyclo-ligase [Heliobacteriaceae bacterium]|jgi:5-formyltetrahydrofolate cyclo-ligase|nr:5-formyltetrahydrofolate cyclo-ligase [Heliobacteriaceae bacterium]